MLIDQEDLDFIQTKFPQVEGWCDVESAYFTTCLLNRQAETGCVGALLEIGVYKGKFLSVLYQRARRTGQPIVGIDTFQWSLAEEVSSKYREIFGSTDGLSLVTADSRQFDAPALIAGMNHQKASFISVDGDHTAAAVRSDLVLVEKVLQTGGIVAVDDFLNSRAIGVSEGTYRYFLESPKPSLRPFAFCANKLYLAESEFHKRYVSAFLDLVADAPDLPIVQSFGHWQKMGPAYVMQALLGSDVLII